MADALSCNVAAVSAIIMGEIRKHSDAFCSSVAYYFRSSDDETNLPGLQVSANMFFM